MSSNHPLPVPPGQSPPAQQPSYGQHYVQEPTSSIRPGGGRQRSRTTFSSHSRKSSNSNKLDLTETHEEKQKRRLQTKADPNMAVSELEPSAVAQGEASNVVSLRAMQHKDLQGNLISEPDRSNPTRSRWERPLDTIRSFEAAIDGSYARKSAYMRSDASLAGTRRNSYYAGSSASYYNGNRASYARPDSYYGGSPGPSQLEYGNQSYGYNQRQRFPPRHNSESVLGHSHHYPNNPVNDAATTASGSGSSGDPLGYQTDPSSENSSVERIQMAARAGPSDGYSSNSAYTLQSGPPQVPNKDAAPRGPIKLGGAQTTSTPTYTPPTPAAATADKRKSWFGRRFSKS